MRKDTYTVKFEGDAVGRGERVEPFPVKVGSTEEIAILVLEVVKPKLISSDVSVQLSFDPDEGLVGHVVVGGWRPVGRFTAILREVATSDE